MWTSALVTLATVALATAATSRYLIRPTKLFGGLAAEEGTTEDSQVPHAYAVSVDPTTGEGLHNDIEYSERHKVAYCNLAKVASATLSMYFVGLQKGFSTFDEVLLSLPPNNFCFDVVRRAPWTQVTPELGYRTLVVSRHPGSRLYSAWYDKVRTAGKYTKLLPLCQGVGGTNLRSGLTGSSHTLLTPTFHLNYHQRFFMC